MNRYGNRAIKCALILFILSTIMAGCSNTDVPKVDKVNITSLNVIFSDQLSQQITSLEKIRLDLIGLRNSGNDESLKNYYSGALASSKQELRTFVYFESFETTNNGETRSIKVPLASALSQTQKIGLTLEKIMKPNAKPLGNYDNLNKLEQLLSKLIVELDQIANDKYFSITKEYDLTEINKIIFEIVNIENY